VYYYVLIQLLAVTDVQGRRRTDNATDSV